MPAPLVVPAVRAAAVTPWHDVVASARDRAGRLGFGMLIALVVVCVPLLELLRYVGERLSHDAD